MAAIGQLTIEMAANVARLQKDMEQARRSVDSTMKQIQRSADLAKKALAGLGVALSAGAFVKWIDNAIKAADEMKKLSQKTGVAVKDIAGLQLAYKQAGLGSDALLTSMSRLSKGMAEGNKAFHAMGLSTKNSDGSLKSTRQMLGEVADKFASYRDGAEKTALAMQLFGKSGAEMIPLLNAGAKSLAEYDEIARKLGLTLDDQTASSAEKFNDTLELVTEGTRGLATQVSARLLPTLEQMAEKFLTSMQEGDRLAKTADTIAAGLKIVYSAALIVVEVFNTLGTRIGATFAAIAQATEGDFRGAWKTWKDAGKDIDENWKKTIADLGDIWSKTGGQSVAAMVATTQAAKKAAPAVNELTAEQLAYAKAVEAANRALVAWQDAQTKALAAGAKQSMDEELALLAVMLDQKEITEREYLERKNAIALQAESETIAALEKAWQESKQRMAEKQKAAAGGDPVALRAYYEAGTDVTNRGAALDAARSDATASGLNRQLDSMRQLRAERDQAIAQNNEIANQVLEIAELEASMVGGNSEFISDIYARETAMLEARYAREFELLDQLIEAKQLAAEEEKAESAKRKRYETEVRNLVEKRAKLEKKQALDQAAIDKQAFRSRMAVASQYAGYVSSALTSLAETQDQTSRDGFEKAKAMQIGAAVINTAGAIMNALATVQPYPLAIAASAAAAAAGAAQISKIQSTKFGGSGGGFTTPSGGFGGGAGGGGVTGSSIGMEYRSVGELQTAESLQKLADAADNASLAVGKMSDMLTSIDDIFGDQGSISKWSLSNAPNQNMATVQFEGLWKQNFDAIGDYLSSVIAPFRNGIMEGLKTILTGGESNFHDALRGMAFGGKWGVKSAGIALSMVDGQLQALNYIIEKKPGSIFGGGSKTRTRYSDMDQQFADMLNLQVEKIKSAISLAAVITGTTTNFGAADLGMAQIQTSGQTPEAIEKALEDFFLNVANSLAATTDGLQEFAFAGENAFDALIRLASALQSTNEKLSLIGMTLLDASLQGANAAYKLQELMGGAEAFADKVTEYFQRVFTEEEQGRRTFLNNLREYRTAINLMNSAFSDDAEITMPRTRDQFQALVESLDLMTERGAALFSALMDVAPAFGDIMDYLDDLSDTALASLETAVEAQREILEKQRDTLKSLFQYLEGQVADLYKGTATTAAVGAVAGRAFIAEALMAARATGMLPNQAALADAVSAVTGSMNASSYGSAFEMNRDRLVLAGRLSQLKDITGTQLTTAEQQLADLDGILDTARKQVDLLRGIDNSVLTVAQAVANLQTALTGVPTGIPQFATGTNYVPADMLAVVHRGEAIVPAAYNPANGGGDVAEELRELREENRAQARAMVALQQRMTRLLEKWDGDGIPEERAVA